MSLSMVTLAACGSSPEPREAPAPEREQPEPVPHQHEQPWMGAHIGIAECDAYISAMARCRPQLPDSSRSNLDDALNALVNAWIQAKDSIDIVPLCNDAMTLASKSLKPACPEVWPD